MTNLLQSIKSQIANLDREERREVVEFTVDLLEDYDFVDDSESVETEWKREIARRRDDFVTGRDLGRPMEDVMADLRRKYNRS